MRSKILAGTIIIGLLAVIALGIVAASPNSQTSTDTRTDAEKAYDLFIASMGEVYPQWKGILYDVFTDIVIEDLIAPRTNETTAQIKARIFAGLDNPTATDKLKAALKDGDPQGVFSNVLANYFISVIADKTGETPAQIRARLSTPPTPTPTPSPTGSPTATPSPTPTPTGSPTATPMPTATPVPPTAWLDIWDVVSWDAANDADRTNAAQNMVVTWDETTLVRRAVSTRTATPTEKTAIDKLTDTVIPPNAQQEVTGHLTRAEIRFDKGNYSGAVADLTSAINVTGANTPDDDILRNLRGIARAFNKDYTNAIADFRTVLEGAETAALRGAAANNRAVVKAFQANYDDALTDYNDLTVLANNKFANNNEGSTYWTRDKADSGDNCDGDAATTESDLDCAVAAYVSAVTAAPSDVHDGRIVNNRGLAYMERGKEVSGVDCDNDDTNDESDLDCAIDDFRAAIASITGDDTPEKARFQNNLGLAHQARGDDGAADRCSGVGGIDSDLDCAIEYFTLAYDNAGDDPDHAAFLNNRGRALTARDNRAADHDCDTGDADLTIDLDCAIEDFTSAIKTYGGSTNPDIYNNRGLAYMERGNTTGDCDTTKTGDQKDIECAITDFGNAIKLRKDDEFYYNRGRAYVARDTSGDEDHAISNFTDAIKLNPADSRFYAERGKAYVSRDDTGDDLRGGRDKVFAQKIQQKSVGCDDFTDFDANYGTSFGSDHAAANAFYAAAKEAGNADDFSALLTNKVVCPTLSSSP